MHYDDLIFDFCFLKFPIIYFVSLRPRTFEEKKCELILLQFYQNY